MKINSNHEIMDSALLTKYIRVCYSAKSMDLQNSDKNPACQLTHAAGGDGLDRRETDKWISISISMYDFFPMFA